MAQATHVGRGSTTVPSHARVHGLTIAASVAFHAALAGIFSWLAFRSVVVELPQTIDHTQRAVGKASSSLDVELPSIGEGILVDDQRVDPNGEPPRNQGGDAVAHLDTATAGHGGELRAETPALNLADLDEHMRLSPDLLSRMDRDQLQRLRVARVRQSWEDRRSTTHPTELALLVTGAGTVLERRAISPREPSRGALHSPAAGVLGSEIGVPPLGVGDETDRTRGSAQPGALAGAPGVGLPVARAGVDHRAAAPIASARPDVTQAAVAIPAIDRARPRDDVDSAQEVATIVRALVHASTAGGVAGQGIGGSGSGPEPGTGGAIGPGSVSRPLGVGEADVFDYWTTDPRLLSYFRQIHSKIDPLWADAFPKGALLDLKQGTVILEFTVLADGHLLVSWPPARPSGIADFDRNCADAIRRASPLPPIPGRLGLRSLRIRAPFVASNPVVK